MDIRDTILIVEDERTTVKLLKTVLKANNYDVLIAASGNEAITLITSHCPDLIILERKLADMDGSDILKYLRAWSSIPVIVLSDSGSEKDKVEVLDLGADDYMSRPFGVSELLARIRVSLRHRNAANYNDLALDKGVLYVGGLAIDYDKHRVMVDGMNAGLTKTEFRLLSLLGRHMGKVVTYDMIFREIWGPGKSSDNRILRVNMSNLRRKIEKNPAEPEYLFTEAGVGFYLKEPDQ